MAERVDPERVAWHAPETLNQRDLAERLADADSPEDALEILNSRSAVGEYRIIEDPAARVDGPEGTTALGPKWGKRAVWVDEHPEDNEDGSGRFEVYSAKDHGDTYKPIIREGQE
jgi:hypothetical protein